MGVKRIEILNTYYITGYHMCDVRLHRPMWSVGENQVLDTVSSSLQMRTGKVGVASLSQVIRRA